MIFKKDKGKIIELGRKYNVKTIYLFGSAISSTDRANDIDLGIEGTPHNSDYFSMVGDFLINFSKPVDFKNIDNYSDDNFFKKNIKKGVILYAG